MSCRQILSDDFQGSWSCGEGGGGGGHTRHGEDEPETLAFCPQLYPGTEPGEAACWELDRLV